MHTNLCFHRSVLSGVCPRLFASLLLSVLGCKPPANQSPNALASQPAAEGQSQPALGLTGTGAFPALNGTANALVNVAKRIMGLNPDAGDKQDHIGLTNVASMFGYDLPFNDCAPAWVLRAGGTSEQPVLVITSDHSHGAGSKCAEANPEAPVRYLFRAWQTAVDNILPVPWSRPPEPKDWPKPSASSNADTASAPAATLDPQGKLTITTQESMQAAAPTGATPTYHVLYERTIRAVPQLTKDTPGEADIGIQLRADQSGNALFTIGSTPTPAALTLLQCAAEIVEPTGCHYRVRLAINFVQSVQHFRALLRAKPSLAGVVGRLRATGDCENRQYRGKDDSCAGSMGEDGKGVLDWFGREDGSLDFAQDMTAQASSDGGHWYWNNIRALPLAQNQGISNLDWALRYFSQGDYSKFSLDFAETTEAVESCTLHVDTLPGSVGNCASIQDGATVVPTLTPQ